MVDFPPIRNRVRVLTLVQRIIGAFTTAVDAQSLRPGMAVPSGREFAREHDVSIYTVASAYQQLVLAGWPRGPAPMRLHSTGNSPA